MEENKPEIVGFAEIDGNTYELEIIDESQLKERGVIRVVYRDERGFRVTSFIAPYQVKYKNPD